MSKTDAGDLLEFDQEKFDDSFMVCRVEDGTPESEYFVCSYQILIKVILICRS